VLLGSEAASVLALLKHVNIGWKVSRPPINVHRVAADLISFPGEYCLGGIWARVEGYGDSLRTMGIFGADLAEAPLLRELMPRLSCYQIRLRDVTRRTEVITVGARGEIGLSHVGREDLLGAEAALGFLSRRGYINWGDDGKDASK
jgi:hypothetical protein